MHWFASLLEHPRQLFRVSILASLIPTLLSLYSPLQVPIFIGLCISLILLNNEKLVQGIKWYMSQNFFVKLTTGMLILGFGVTMYLIFVLFTLTTIDIDVVLIAFLALILNLIWFSTVRQRYEEFSFNPILKGETKSSANNYRWEIILEPLPLIIPLTLLIVLIDSFIQTQGRSIFVENTLWWLGIPLVIIANSSIHMIALDQLYWQPKEGKTEFIERDIPKFPNPIYTQRFSKYIEIIGKQKHPPEEFFPKFEEYLPLIVEKSRELEFTPVFHNLVQAYSYWGESAKEKLHYLHLVVTSVLSRYQTFGLVPLYNRFYFYTYLELLYKHRVLSSEWMELLQYELEEGKDHHHRLDWIASIPYDKVHENNYWFTLWNGKIFKGQEGYNRIQQAIPPDTEKMPIDDQWTNDIWELTYRYLKMFIGIKGRSVLDGEYELDEAIGFLAEKKTLDEFYEYKEEYKKELLERRERYVKTSTTSTTEKRKGKEQLDAYLQGESYRVAKSGGIKAKIVNLWNKLKNIGNQENRSKLIPMIILTIIGVANIGLLYFISWYIPSRGIDAIIVIELLTLFFFAVPQDQETSLQQDQSMSSGEDTNIGSQQYQTKELDSGSSISIRLLYLAALTIIGYSSFL